MPMLAPMEIAARLARKEVKKHTGLPDSDIGVFFITPCAAKVTEVNSPTTGEKSACNGCRVKCFSYNKFNGMRKLGDVCADDN